MTNCAVKTPKKSAPTGPLESVTVKGSTVAIYRTPRAAGGKTYDAFTLSYTSAGQRCRKLVANLDKARDTAKTIASQLAEGTGHVHALTPQQVSDFHAAERILRQHPGVSLSRCVSQWSEAVRTLAGRGSLTGAAEKLVRALDRQKLPDITVAKLVDAFIAAKEGEGLSDYYVKDIKRKLDRLAKSFQCPIASVRAEEIAAWITKQGGSMRTANNLRNSVVTLFSFGRDAGYLSREEKTQAELVKRRKERPPTIGIYSPDQIAAILAATPDNLLPAVATAAFAGLRSAEIFRLAWEDIRLDRGHILVSPEKAKTASRRLVPISDNLRQWLAPHAARKGNVTPTYAHLDNFTRKFAEICSAAGVAAQRNGFRHSFASYRLAVVESADKVALEMGNSPRKLFTNYRELVTVADAKSWFAVCPPAAPANVVPYPSQKVA